MKTLKAIIYKSILCLPALLFVSSCGLQSPYDIKLNMNSPYITRVVPGDGKVTLYVQGQNVEDGFAGYNVYVGDDYVDLTKTVLVNSGLRLPTVEADSSSALEETEIVIADRKFYTKERSKVLSNEYGIRQIQNGNLYYFWVSSYDYNLDHESSYSEFNRVSACPRPQSKDVSLSSGSSLALYQSTAHLSLVEDGGNLYFSPTNGCGIQSMGYAEDGLHEVSMAPEHGYIQTEVPVIEGVLYSLKTPTENYAKVYVSSVNGSSITVDHCYQISEGIRSY